MIFLIWAAAAIGAVLVVVGVAMFSAPAAFIVAGLTFVAAAYVVRYLEVQREAT